VVLKIGQKHPYELARAAVTAAALSLACGLCAAEPVPPGPPPAAVFFEQPDIGEVHLSPSGRYLAFTSPRGEDRHLALFIMDLAPGGGVKQRDHVATTDISEVQWVTDDRLLVTLANVRTADTMWPAHYVVEREGTGRYQLRETGSNTSFRVLQPGPEHADNEVLGTSYGERVEGTPWSEPFWLNIENGRTRPVKPRADDTAHMSDWLFDDQGVARIVTTHNLLNLAAFWREKDSDQWQPLVQGTVRDIAFWPVAVGRNGEIYVAWREGPDQRLVLGTYDRAAKRPYPKPLVTVPGFDFDGGLIFDPRSGALLGVRANADAQTAFWFDPAMKKLQAEVDAQLPGHVNQITCRHCGEAGETVLVRSSSDRDPGHLYLRRRVDGEIAWTALGAVRKAVDPARMADVDMVRIKARDGLEIPVWITRSPQVQAGHPAPAVLLVHGGPWVRNGEWHWDPMAQFLASRGYLVIEPEFRGSTGYGDRLYHAGFRQWGRAMQDDVTDALRWAQQQGLATDKACIMGASYGGYSTLMGLIKDPDLYRCGIAWVALADLDLYLKGSWRVADDISDVGRRFTLPEMVGDAEKDAALLAAVNPLRRAAEIKKPLLLAYGGYDRRVPPVNGERLRDALIQAGNPPEYVVYEKEGHGFLEPVNRIDFARRVEAFLARHLPVPSAP